MTARSGNSLRHGQRLVKAGMQLPNYQGKGRPLGQRKASSGGGAPLTTQLGAGDMRCNSSMSALPTLHLFFDEVVHQVGEHALDGVRAETFLRGPLAALFEHGFEALGRTN